MRNFSHDTVLKQLGQVLESLEALEQVKHPSRDTTPSKLGAWITQLNKVKDLTSGLVTIVWSDLPQDTRDILLRIRQEENRIAWTSDTEVVTVDVDSVTVEGEKQ